MGQWYSKIIFQECGPTCMWLAIIAPCWMTSRCGKSWAWFNFAAPALAPLLHQQTGSIQMKRAAFILHRATVIVNTPVHQTLCTLSMVFNYNMLRFNLNNRNVYHNNMITSSQSWSVIHVQFSPNLKFKMQVWSLISVIDNWMSYYKRFSLFKNITLVNRFRFGGI